MIPSTVSSAMGSIIMGKLLSRKGVERVKDGMSNCQTNMHILTTVLTISVATFVVMVVTRIRGLLGVIVEKEHPRDGKSAISLDADPKNPYYLRSWLTERLTQYAATDLWITTAEPLKYAVF
jgi:hypothetical protein